MEVMFMLKKSLAETKNKEVLWQKYALVYDTLNSFYPYEVLINKVTNEVLELINLVKTNTKSEAVRILDIGCGTGNILQGLKGQKGVEFLAFDKYKAMLEIAKTKFNKQNDNISFIIGDADQENFGWKTNPIEQNSVDITILNLALFNIYNKQRLMQIINTISKSDAYLLITDFKPDNQKKALVRAHIKNRGLISFIKNFKNSMKINIYTKKIFDKNTSPFVYLDLPEFESLFKDTGFKLIKSEDVYENQANMLIGQK